MTLVAYSGNDGWRLWTQVLPRNRTGDGVRDLPIVLLHGGGPDHEMFLPLARELAEHHTIALPDIRGYGKSRCADPARHTWAQYVDDVVSLLDHLGWPRAIVGGAGLGSTIALRTALAYPERVEALILMSVEDIEDDVRKQAEIAFMDAFAERARSEGIEAAWAPILSDLAPIIGTLVRDAISRSDAASIAAAAAIGLGRSFHSADELAVITAPTLIIPGMDERHPRMLAEDVVRLLPRGVLATVGLSEDLRTAEDLGRAFAPTIRAFLEQVRHSRI